jgi:hypothetical protein
MDSKTERGRLQLMKVARQVRDLPYTWPAPPTAEWTKRNGRGTCAGKHALLAQELAAVGLDAHPLLIVGPLVPEGFPEWRKAVGELLEVHECLTVETPWAGPLLVDITWHPEAIKSGMPGTLEWDADRDMIPAVAIGSGCYAVSPTRLREQKEALRRRLYTPAEREKRDELLQAIASRFAR